MRHPIIFWDDVAEFLRCDICKQVAESLWITSCCPPAARRTPDMQSQICDSCVGVAEKQMAAAGAQHTICPQCRNRLEAETFPVLTRMAQTMRVFCRCCGQLQLPSLIESHIENTHFRSGGPTNRAPVIGQAAAAAGVQTPALQQQQQQQRAAGGPAAAPAHPQRGAGGGSRRPAGGLQQPVAQRRRQPAADAENPLAAAAAAAGRQKNAAVAWKHPSIGKHYCYKRIAYPPHADPENDCRCREHTGGVCAPFAKNGKVGGCNCRHCMALDVEELKRQPRSSGSANAWTLVNWKGRPSEGFFSGPFVKFYCGARLCGGSLCSAATGNKCHSCGHLTQNWSTRGYSVLMK